jgi:hypothetical protein
MQRNLKCRVVKLEKAMGLGRPDGSVFFMIWGADQQDLEERLAASNERGEVLTGDVAVCLVWPHDAPAPKPRWIGDERLRDQEEDAITGHIQRACREASLKEEDHSQRADVDLIGFSNAELIAMIFGQRVQ